MRRNNFLVGALVAIVTFVSLSAFVGRPWDWHRGWRQHRCYYDDRYYDRNAPGNEPRHDSIPIQ
jgi:hypothetical protein